MSLVNSVSTARKYKLFKLTEEDIEEMRSLRKQGWTIENIAYKFHLSSSTVVYHTNPEARNNALQKHRERYYKKLGKKPKPKPSGSSFDAILKVAKSG